LEDINRKSSFNILGWGCGVLGSHAIGCLEAYVLLIGREASHTSGNKRSHGLNVLITVVYTRY